MAEDKSKYNVSSFPGTFFSSSPKKAPPIDPIRKATTRTSAISFLGINGFNIPIEKTNTINIMNKITYTIAIKISINSRAN